MSLRFAAGDMSCDPIARSHPLNNLIRNTFFAAGLLLSEGISTIHLRKAALPPRRQLPLLPCSSRALNS